MPDGWVTGTELAAALGITETGVRKHHKRGLFRRNSQKMYHLEDSKAAYAMNRDPDRVAGGIASLAAAAEANGESPARSLGIQENGLTRARAIQATIKAQREKLALDKARGEVLRTEDAYRAVRAVIGVVTERLDGAAGQIGPRVVGLDAAAAERVARDVLRGVRAEIAGLATALKEAIDAESP
jgi:hypothetical protein